MPELPLHPTARYASLLASFEAHAKGVFRKAGQVFDNSCLGRAGTTRLTVQQPMTVPLRKSRAGERQPCDDIMSMQYHRHFKQLRRLVNYSRLVRMQNTSANGLIHKVSLWSSILKATGFPQGFPEWWKANMTSDSSSSLVPCEPPAHAVALQLQQEFSLRVDQLEKVLRRHRVAAAKTRRQNDVNAIFKDIKSDSAAPVETLLTKSFAVVSSLEEENSICFDPPDSLQGEQPILGPDGLLVANHVQDGQAWLAEEHTLKPGDVLSQSKPVGSIAEIQDLFCKEWQARWGRHDAKADDDWGPIFNVIEEVLPNPMQPMQLMPLDDRRLKRFIQSRKPRSAVGLDGVSRNDVLAMPPNVLQEVCSLYAHAEETGRWPTQLVHGAVRALQKHQDAAEVAEFRPITIYPLLYRAWSSLRSREIITFLSPFAPIDLHGNRVGCTAVGIWWRLQAALELHMYSGLPCSGIALDIIKAFNLLPRAPLFRAAMFLQIHPKILQSWWGFLGVMQRHFSIRQSLSRGCDSSTGFPEGCGLSVCSMMLFNFVLHRWMHHRWPSLTVTSYVDNLSIQSSSPEMAEAGHQSLRVFMSAMDVELDEKKTFGWALSTADRKHFRANDMQVCLQARDLGGHMQFCQRHSNSTIETKLAQLDKMWSRLLRSPAPASQKMRAARIAQIGPQHLKHQRSQLIRAARYDGPGVNAFVTLGLFAPPASDPGFWILKNSVALFRRYASDHWSHMLLAEAQHEVPRRRKPGPHGTMLTRIAEIGWRYAGGSSVVDAVGHQFDLLEIAPQELELRLRWAWFQKVASEVGHRSSFQGLAEVDPGLTRKCLRGLAKEASGFVRIALTGAFVVPHQSFVSEEQCKCVHCGEQDSLYHRNWECSSTAKFREQLSATFWQVKGSLPRCTLEHGWLTLSQSICSLRHELHCTPDSTGEFTVNPDHWTGTLGIDLFPDGTCCRPTCPHSRVAAWAVACTHWDNPESYLPLASGFVPGVLQTVTRAEILAVISCLRFARLTHLTCRIWCDNQTVVSRVQAILSGHFTSDPKKADSDLWQVVMSLCDGISDRVMILKVTSHLAPATLAEDEQWVRLGNQWADECAGSGASVGISSICP